MSSVTPTNKQPKFYFEIDGLRYGGRYLTIAEAATVGVEVDRLTNGKHAEWVKSEEMQTTAYAVYAAVTLSRVICMWPTGMEPIDFPNSDDFEQVFRYWSAYQTAADSFRAERAGGVARPDVG